MNTPAALDRIAFLGGFAPRRCGIATFTQDLCEAVALAAPQATSLAVAMNDRPEGYAYPTRVRMEIPEKDLDAYRRAADQLNFENTDLLCVQHEFGIYGGEAGSHLLALLKEVRMPVVTTLHTVLAAPDPAQRAVMDELVKRSARLVVMARKGAEILEGVYGVPSEKIDVIAHGIPDIPFGDTRTSKPQFGVEGRTVLLTFGLLGPGKGIEFAIEALPEIVKFHPEVVYLVLGATHPHLVAREGERYRLGLERLAEGLGVKDHVIFHDRFVSLADLAEFIGITDIYLTPYLNEAQITSGTLAYVFGAGKAVVSTPYWHAQELLAEGRGMLVPFRDSQAIATAVCAYLDHPELMESTRHEAFRMGRAMTWPAVAELYLESFSKACRDGKVAARTAFAAWTLGSRPADLPPRRLDHVARMSDATGIFQHAIFNVPNYHEGYCTDDNARAFLLCVHLQELGAALPEAIEALCTSSLAFLAAALNPQCRFRNFMSHGHAWLEEAGSEDSHARALWALGTGAARARDEGHRRLSRQLFEKGIDAVPGFTSPRAWAFTLLGLHESLRGGAQDPCATELRTRLVERLLTRWKDCATPEWQWFEDSATYDNARISQAMIQGGSALGNDEAVAIGLASLRWLASLQTTPAGNFRPVGSNGFCRRDGARADFDQQPVEAQAMVSACLEAFRVTGDAVWMREARRAFEWFLGRNDRGEPLYDPATGGCRDGLHADRTSENLGAESTLAFHLALCEMTTAQAAPAPKVRP